jgi:hypothetical protein
VADWWVARLTVGALILVLAAVVAVRARGLAWYGYAAAVAGAVVWPTAAALSGVEPAGVYAGIGLLTLAAAIATVPYRPVPVPRPAPEAVAEPAPEPEAASTPQPAPEPGAAASGTGAVVRARTIPDQIAIALAVALAASIPGALLFLAAVLRPVLAVAALPYSWLSGVWTGAAGIGLAPTDAVDATAHPADAVALGLLALACALGAYAVTRRAAPAIAGFWVVGPTALLVALVAASALLARRAGRDAP